MTILYVLLAIFLFGIMILVHELGHFTMARIFHVTIREFSIGMGPKIVSHLGKKSGIRYSLRLLPIGGFVSMVGEDEYAEEAGALNQKPVWQRICITAAGPVVNILCAILVMCISVSISPALGSTRIHSFAENAQVYSQQSGLCVNDVITHVGNASVHTSTQLSYEIMQQGSKSTQISQIDNDNDGTVDAVTVVLPSLTVRRDGKTVVLENVKFPGYVTVGHVFGDVDFTVWAENKSVGNVLKHAVYDSWNTFQVIWDSLVGLLGGQYSVRDMSGPVGVTDAISTAAQSGMENLLYIFVLISMNLGVFNLLPVPALDGGRLVFLLIEWIRGKPIDPRVEGYVHFVGICALLLLMVFATFQDVVRLF